jgi:hypothetical protein
MDGPSEPQYWDTGTDSHSTSKGHIMTYPSTQRKQQFRSGTQTRCHCIIIFRNFSMPNSASLNLPQDPPRKRKYSQKNYPSNGFPVGRMTKNHRQTANPRLRKSYPTSNTSMIFPFFIPPIIN